MSTIFPVIDTAMLAAIVAGLIMFGFIFYFWQSRMETKARNEVQKLLDIKKSASGLGKDGNPLGSAAPGTVASKAPPNLSL